MRKLGDWMRHNGYLFNLRTRQLVCIVGTDTGADIKCFIKSDAFSGLCQSQPIIPVQKARAHTILALELTDRCNYACAYCFEGESQRNSNVMDLEMAMTVIDSLPEGSELRFFGGEPLLEFKLIQTIVQKYPRMRFSIVTNGSLVDERIATFLAENSFSVGISYDGAGWQEKHRIACKGDSTADFIKAMGVFERHGVYVGVSTTVTRESMSHLYDIHLEIFADFPVQGWAYLLAYSPDMTMRDLDIFEEQIMQIITDFPAQHLLRINDLRTWAMKVAGTWPIDAYCGAGVCYSALTVHGEQRICPFFLRESSCYGPNIRTEEVDCRQCDIWPYCHGGCLSLNMYGSGNTHKGHPFACRKNHIYFKAGLATAIKARKEGLII